MAINLTFNTDGIAHLTCESDITVNEAVTAVGELYQDSRFTMPSRVLWDLSSGRITWKAAELETFAHFIESNRPRGPGKVAFVAGDDLSFGIWRMYELMNYDIPVELSVFRDLNASIEWLNADTMAELPSIAESS